MAKSAKLVQRRRGARRRSKLKLLLQLFVSFVFLGTALLLSAGIVQVVERPVAPWKQKQVVVEVSEAGPGLVDPQTGSADSGPTDDLTLVAPIVAAEH